MKKIISIILAAALVFSLAACGNSGNNETTAAQETEIATEATTEANSEDTSETTEAETTGAAGTGADINIYVLSGPTGIGAMNLWNASDEGTTINNYNFTMPGANDEVVAAVSKGDADIAAVATNLAATLYNRTEGGITVLAVNTFGVLSILTKDTEFTTIEDLKGKTIYSPGQGANPEYILKYVLTGNGIDPDNDVTINFVGEGSELLTIWESEPEAVIMAPQPVATSLLMQNEGASKAFDMTEEWDKIAGEESTLMMGCVIVRNEFLEENPEAVETFLAEYQASIETAAADVEGTAALCEKYGLIPKAALAQKAIPQCGLTFVIGEEMKSQLSGYLQVMFDSNPKSVGGALPEDDFYYVGQ